MLLSSAVRIPQSAIELFMLSTASQAQGVLELHPKGYGFLRNPAKSYAALPGDPYVPAPLIQQHHLREGLLLAGPVEAGKKGAGPRLTRLEGIEGEVPDK